MTKTAKAVTTGLGWAIGMGLATFALAQTPAGSDPVPTYRLNEIGLGDRFSRVGQMLLIQREIVQQELKMTDAQMKEQKAIVEWQSQKIQQVPHKATRWRNP